MIGNTRLRRALVQMESQQQQVYYDANEGEYGYEEGEEEEEHDPDVEVELPDDHPHIEEQVTLLQAPRLARKEQYNKIVI